MDQQLFIALLGFTFVTSVTPGPNNLMVMTSGANFGFVRTGWHMLGICVGFAVMIQLVGLGLMGVFDAYPASQTVLSVAAIAYMLWLAWKIANAAAPEAGNNSAKPFSFLQAAGFQWVNPKGWAMALTAVAAYAPDRSVWAVAVVALVFGAMCLPCVALWAWIGQEIRRFLGTPGRLRAFNWTMAAMLIASMVPLLRF